LVKYGWKPHGFDKVEQENSRILVEDP